MNSISSGLVRYEADQSLVTQGNQLIEGSYDINLAEIRLLWLALSKVDSKNPKPENEFTLTASEYSKMYELDISNCSSQMKTVAETLGTKPIITYEFNDKRKRLEKVILYWFSSIRYGLNNGADLTLRFSDEVSQFLYELKTEFTQMNILSMVKLDTPFSFRLFSWLSRYKNLDKYKKNGVVTTEAISIDWMKDRAGLTGRYSDFKNFRVRLIDPAIEAINRTTELSVSYETIKIGKTVTHIVFSYINEKDSAYLKVKPMPPKLPRRPRVIKNSHDEGVWARKCLELLKKYESDLLGYDVNSKVPIAYLRKMASYYNVIGDKLGEKMILKEIENRK
ncbi:Plasmid replication protein [Pectobacterium atrosepticum ICMP 1526]|uniref:replication initiation protein n=1 Tax=Pectobacterium atrosepticum TaxID=29471 RepID=UPI0005077DA8|nr:replication initiation protein [Pectobacterium atrosepticum]KFX10734.1 plasmid replication protein [Pectobacterium atrosepticum]KMK87227.1 Plasmid replication protein [Pectobacterium atrosepticum ICMP 1526]